VLNTVWLVTLLLLAYTLVLLLYAYLRVLNELGFWEALALSGLAVVTVLVFATYCNTRREDS
jgi:hypothetical protein